MSGRIVPLIVAGAVGYLMLKEEEERKRERVPSAPPEKLAPPRERRKPAPPAEQPLPAPYNRTRSKCWEICAPQAICEYEIIEQEVVVERGGIVQRNPRVVRRGRVTGRSKICHEVGPGRDAYIKWREVGRATPPGKKRVCRRIACSTRYCEYIARSRKTGRVLSRGVVVSGVERCWEVDQDDDVIVTAKPYVEGKPKPPPKKEEPGRRVGVPEKPAPPPEKPPVEKRDPCVWFKGKKVAVRTTRRVSCSEPGVYRIVQIQCGRVVTQYVNPSNEFVERKKREGCRVVNEWCQRDVVETRDCYEICRKYGYGTASSVCRG